MQTNSASAIAHPNIAFIKYWGDRIPELHIPANGSISMNLEELQTQTTVQLDPSYEQDVLILNGERQNGEALERVSAFLKRVRHMAGIATFAQVETKNNFPIAAGIASSAAGFAALSLAASAAAGLELDEADLSRLARTGSGSACRSVPGGFVEWQAGQDHHDSYAWSIAPPDYWDLVDCIALVSREEKSASSSMGHALANSSPLQHDRLVDTPRRLSLCREAILERDIEKLARVVELDSNMMHAVMFTSSPPIIYWQPATLTIIQAIQSMRKNGIPVCYTIDAGPNVHTLCSGDVSGMVTEQLSQLPGVLQVLTTHPGGSATWSEFYQPN
ncbi:MAG TPA: diphosphomevalonate decarboxylase [Anaerolineales bacterium]|nr:diphosphomevalonate decarboxylase [Anaerolineales bacterium]